MRAADASRNDGSTTYIEAIMPGSHEGLYVEMPMDKGSEMEMGMEHRHQFAQHHETRQTVNKINDELRFSIIDAVYLRPAIWDHGRELRNLGQRKDHFIEIAALLSTDKNMLSYSYYKLRKKLKVDASGNLVQPRWKFFSSMMFLEQLNGDRSAFPEPTTSMTDEFSLGKRSADRNLVNVALRRHLNDEHCRLEKAINSTPVSSIIEGQPSVSTVLAPEDEYSAFCNSLIYPLREIGNMDRLEYLKLEKVIRDVIHEKQMELLKKQQQQQQQHLGTGTNKFLD